MESSENRHLRRDSLPVVDLRLLSQSELFSLSDCSSENENEGNRHRNDTDYDDGILIPQIDHSVFNESAGSRKQTYTRLRLAPSAAVAARRSQSLAPAPPDPDSLQIGELLKHFFASNTETSQRRDECPGGIAPGDSATEVDCTNPAAAPSISPSRGFPLEIVSGLLLPDEDELPKPKRGRSMTLPLHTELKVKPEGLGDCSAAEEAPVPPPCSVVSFVDSEKQNTVVAVAENNGGGSEAVDWGNCPPSAPVSTTPLSDPVDSDSTNRKPEAESFSQELISQHPANPAPTASEAVVPLPVPPENAVSDNPASNSESAPGFTYAASGGGSSAGANVPRS